MRSPRTATRRKSAGQTLVIAMIILGVLLALGLVFLAIVSRNIQQTSANRQRTAASDLAEASIRYAHSQLLQTTAGADWRPEPTIPTPAGSPDITRDPDILYIRPGSGMGLRTDTDPQKDLGGPDGLGPYTRVSTNNGRGLVRVRFAPSDANIFTSQPSGPLRNPGRARMYTIIEAVGRPGRLTFNDPTSLNSGNAVQFQNYADGASFRNALALMKKFDSQIVLSSKQIAFASIGIIETQRYITDKYHLSRPVNIGIPSNFGSVYKGVDVQSGKDLATGNVVTTPLSMVMGIDMPLFNFGDPPTPTASLVGLGGSLFSNVDLRVNGTIYAKLNAPLGEIWAISALLYGATDDAKLEVERNTIDPVTGAWVAPTTTTLQTGGNPDLSSRGLNFSTVFGQVRDGIATTDSDGFQRGVGTKDPPRAFDRDPDTGMTRYVLATRESGALVGNGNSGRFGYGSSVYVDNFADRQSPADERARAQVGTSGALVNDWLNPNNNQPNSGWQGAFYVPRGAYVRLLIDGFTIERDARAPAAQKFWKGPDGNQPTNSQGQPVQSGSIRYRIGFDSNGIQRIINSYTPDPTDPSRAVDIDAASPNFDAGYPFGGVLYFEGNVRIRGIIPTDVQLTVVSDATIYVEGSITKGVTDESGARLTRPSRSALMLIAHDYVAINTTQFFGPASGQNLEEVNDSSSAISFNPVRMRVGGAPLRFITEIPLDPRANPNNPSTWGPYAMDYREYQSPDPTENNGPAITTRLLLTHTMDDGPAPATYTSLNVNFGLDNPNTVTTDDWVYQFQLTNNNAATQPYIDAGAAAGDYRPIYGLGVETWQRYSRFETIGFPLITGNFAYDTTNGYLLESTGPPADPQGTYALTTELTNEFSIEHNNVGNDPTNDYLLARAAMVPADVRIEASVYAEDGSFFVIPGPPFNPNPNDRREVFEAAVNANGGFSDSSAIQQALQERLENFGTFPETPFYGEPLDVRIVIVGAISENTPASMDQQAQWLKRWGWIPGQIGALYDLSGATPRPILIPKSHVPSGYDLLGGTNPALFVPNLIYAYDPVLATARVNGFDASPANPVLRQDAYGRTLPPMPKLPVSPTLAYFGEVNQ